MSEARHGNWFSSLCPQPPGWKLDWDEKFAPLEWVKPMIGCKQDPVHHAEGDVATHVKLVCEALLAIGEWRKLDVEDRATVFFGAAMHDVAKPECTVIDADGRISSLGHGKKGAQLVRRLLWRGEGFIDTTPPLAVRESVAAMVRYSSLPLWLWDKEDPVRAAIRASQSVRLDWLALLAQADARGRICGDLPDLISRIQLFREYAVEHGCLSKAYKFPSDHSRFTYFHQPLETGTGNVGKSGKSGQSGKGGQSGKDGTKTGKAVKASDPSRLVYDDTRFEVTVMAGLPGAGKNRWIADNAESLPVVSLDEIRTRLGKNMKHDQTKVVLIAREEARKLMRDGKPFVWNATNVTRFTRDPLVRFFRDYGARIRMVYVEPPSFRELTKRNANRESPVPQAVLDRLADKLEVPDLTEAHQLIVVRS